MSARQKYLTIGLWITAVVGMVVVLAMRMLPPGRERGAAIASTDMDVPVTSAAQLPQDFKTPTFSLVDQNGKKTTDADLVGHVWIGDFIFTNCSSICPQMSAYMQQLQKKLPTSVKLVSFSVDPDHDTPPVLLAYAQKLQADPDRWTFLTGDLQVMKNVVDGMKLAFEPASKDSPNILHDPHFVLVDSSGMIRGYYDSNRPAQIDRLVREAGLLSQARAPATQQGN